MAYNDFDLTRVQAEFGVTLGSPVSLLGTISPVPVAPAVQDSLSRHHPLATTVNTEKARSELLIAPLLTEVWRIGAGRVAMYSGVAFPADPEAGLTGVCDYILGLPPQFHFVTAPVVVVVEAKNESIAGGLGQCAAAMVGAQRFNRGRNPRIDTVYGCVSDGAKWRFLRLRGTDLDIDMTEYLINEPDRILGLLLYCVGVSPTPVAA